MGIPSYYKRLIDRFPKLVTKGHALNGMRSDILLMDFNCLIYQCVRAEKLPVYSSEGREVWEAALIEEVKRYTVKVWEAAGRPRQVYIAVDGVVPMAKIRQQRQRRFKSLWWAAKEREAGIRGAETWDTNSITPGTEFMEKLGRGLKQLATSRGGGAGGQWTVSGADEPGEGEQKLMAWVRGCSDGLKGKGVVVYGLDADLIVLSLLNVTGAVPEVGSWRLLRELAEFEKGAAGTDGDGAFACFDIKELLAILVPSGMSAKEYILEYTCGMSFLGNDFLPHSLSVKMREGGHDLMCRTLTGLHTAGERLVGPEGKVLSRGCRLFLEGWAASEEEWIADNFDSKYKMRGPPPRNEKETAMVAVQNLPLQWKDESVAWLKGFGLLAGWRGVYRDHWLRGASAEQVSREYMQGLQWIMDYYRGQAISYTWYYPWNVPPLWSDLVKAFAGAAEGLDAPPVSSPVAPQEQLAMVLPMGSWWLVRDVGLRALPSKAPVYWPEGFGFFTVGRRWMWECEAEIPILTASRMRGLLG